eukprot:6120805-Amphidinium_carterae.1
MHDLAFAVGTFRVGEMPTPILHGVTPSMGITHIQPDNSWNAADFELQAHDTFEITSSSAPTREADVDLSRQNSEMLNSPPLNAWQDQSNAMDQLQACGCEADKISALFCPPTSREQAEVHGRNEQKLTVAFQNVLSLDATEWREGALRGLNETTRLRWMIRKVKEKGIDIFGMVETRLPEDAEFTTETYKIIGFRAVAGHDGQMILLNEARHPKVLWKEALSERVARVKIMLAKRPILVVLAHGPVACATDEEHGIFLRDLQEALSTGREAGDSLILLADLNARFKACRHLGAIGMMAWSDPVPGDEARTARLAKLLTEQGILLANTFAYHENPSTWHHSTGYSAQIDYVGLSRHLHGHLSHVRVEPRQEWTSSCMSDHDIIVVELNTGWCGTKSQRRARATRRKGPLVKTFVNNDHKQSFIESFEAYKQQAGQSCGPASNRFSSLVSDAAKVLNETAPQRTQKPKKDWISEETWSEVQRVASLRKQLKLATDARLRGVIRHTFDAWKRCLREGEPEEAAGWRHWTVVRFRMRCQVFVALRKMRRLSKRDRKLWMNGQCAEMQAMATGGKVKDYYMRLNQLTKKKTVQHAVLRAKSGSKAYTEKAVGDAWSEHWQTVFNAKEVDMDVDFNSYDVNATVKHQETAAIGEDEVWRALASSACGKVSPDPISIDVLKTIASDATPLLAEMYTHYVRTACAPNTFRGGVIVPIHKKGVWSDPGNFRPICLMNNAAKMFNRVILERLGFDELPSTQFSGPRSSVDFPLLCCSTLLRFLRSQNVGGAFLFLDVQQAYDNVSRPYLMGDESEDLLEDPESVLASGVSYRTALRMAERFMQHIPELKAMGVDPALLDVIRSSNTSTWLRTTSAHGARTLMTTKGIRQGCRLAPYLFCCFHNIATRRLRDRMDEAGILMRLPMSPRLLTQGECETYDVEISNLSFVDDLLTPVWSADPVVLLSMAATLARVLIYTFEEVGLPVNLKPQKTEFLIALRGAKSKDLYEGLRFDGALCGETCPVLVYKRQDGEKPKGVRVAKHYKYLGKFMTPTGSQLKETRARAAQAMSAIKDLKRVFVSVGLSARTKVTTLMLKVLSILLFGVHTMTRMTGPELKTLNTAYMAAIRCAAGESWGQHRVMTDDEVLKKVNLPTLDLQICARRAAFWPKIFTHRSPIIRACLSTDFSEVSWWTPQFLALASMKKKCAELSAWPEPSIETIGLWRDGAQLLGAKWTIMARSLSHVKKAVGGVFMPAAQLHTPVRKDQAEARSMNEADVGTDNTRDVEQNNDEEDDMLRALEEALRGQVDADVEADVGADYMCDDKQYTDEEDDMVRALEEALTGSVDADSKEPVIAPFTCELCGRVNRSHRGLQSHLRQKHKQVSAMALRVTGLKCVACNCHFRSRQMLLQHLRDVPDCHKWTEQNLQPMTVEEYRIFTKTNWGARPLDLEDVSNRPSMGPKVRSTETGRPESRISIPLVCIDLPALT